MRADVRIIAATNRDLEQAWPIGHFRADLTSVWRCSRWCAPLRERPEDIPLLVRAVADEIGQKMENGRDHRGGKPRGAAWYAWPGNVRELRNVVEGDHLERRGTLRIERPLPRAKAGR